MAGKTARDIMTSSPAVCTPETTARDAARMMEDNDCGSLPVVESRDTMKLLGIVTDRDLALRILGRGQSPDIPFIDQMGWLMVWGTTLLFVDAILVILLYEKLGRQFAKLPTPPVQPGHHGADRRVHDFGDLIVRESFDVGQVDR